MATVGDMKGLLRDLRAQGWDVVQTTRGHYRAKPPGDGQIVHFSDSAEPRAWHNILSQLAKSGFNGTAQKRAQPATDSAVLCPSCGGPFNAQIGECSGACSAVEEPDLEKCWAQLKEAKELLLLAEGELTSASFALQAAERSQREAEAQVERCRQVLVGAKKRFDKTFGGGQ